MRGQRNHKRFCRGALEIEHATVRGRLYDLPYGFPALVVPEADVQGTGAIAYAPTEYHTLPGSGSPGWDVVHGELMVFDDPERRLDALDVLEGYVPGEESLYERVLIPVAAAGEVVLAWAYRVEKATGVYLPGGRWPGS